MSLAKNVEFLRRLPKPFEFNGLGVFARSLTPPGDSPLVEIAEFGANPGELRMFSFVPDHLPPAPALVVVLHGCGQTAAGYDMGAGWSTLAEHYGFALLMPEQLLAADLADVVVDIEDIRQIDRLAGRYEVSTQAMTYRLLNLHSMGRV